MNRELIEEHLARSGMTHEQAHGLSRIFDEMATKTDVVGLEQKIGALDQKLESRFDALRGELRAEIAGLEARLTWRFVAAIIFLGALMTLLDVFVN